MHPLLRLEFLVYLLLSWIVNNGYADSWIITDELENNISPEDLAELMKWNYIKDTESTDLYELAAQNDYWYEFPTVLSESDQISPAVNCFGLGRFIHILINMQPGSAEDVNTHFYFTSRRNPERVQVLPEEQFGLEWIDFDPNRKTIMIVHGFMSHSNATWVTNMTQAFLQWGDVNVIAVDWSKGGNTWKYWRAVANTRRVGSDVTGFLRKLMERTGAKAKDFHFIGHSLGAHISSYVSYQLGGVGRITGLDPAMPCFHTNSLVERLDASDADFVDVIHTNGRLLNKFGFGIPHPSGHADFYPNGGMKQPGCYNTSGSTISRIISMPLASLHAAICSHGRSYILFTESLINNNCKFRSHRWNLTYEGVNATLKAARGRRTSCSEMGIRAVGGSAHRREGALLPKGMGASSFITRTAKGSPRRFPLRRIGLNDHRSSKSLCRPSAK